MKVFVGVSGGVDSAVSAALLKQQGFDVTAAYIKIWSPEFTECTWKEDRIEAMRVAVAIGAPFLEVDLSEQYKALVVSDMVQKYQQGMTPNPDVLCNRRIKFGLFSAWAYANGADMVATGHYAQALLHNGKPGLFCGVDENKDQSYFLHTLTQDDLERILFPVGKYPKRVVRELAREFKLPNAERPDSQGLCFVGDITLKDFLSHYAAMEPGNVLNEYGTVIGTHEGAALYTLGQRHGLHIPGSLHEHFVTNVEINQNTVQVSRNRCDAETSTVKVAQMHWIEGVPVQECEIQVRYREQRVAARFDESSLLFTLREPRICAPGQSLVAYAGTHCLGGGVICKQ